MQYKTESRIIAQLLADGETEVWEWGDLKVPENRPFSLEGGYQGGNTSHLSLSSEEASSFGVISKVGRGWQR